MKAWRFVAGLLSILTVISCQKQTDWISNPGSAGLGTGTGSGGGTTGGTGLLVKLTIKNAFDSTAMLYGYDGSQKLISHTMKVIGALSSGDFRKHILRDAQGRVSVLIDSSEKTGGWDTTRTTVYYSGTTTTALYALAKSSSTDIDSIVFTYASSRITKITYYNSAGSGSYTRNKEVVFGYDGSGNVNSIKNYDISGTTPTLQTQSTVTFDTKVSPWNLGNDGLIIYCAGAIDGGETTVGPNNSLVTTDVDNSSGTPATDVTTVTYTYFSNNKPSAATASYVPSGSPVGIPSNVVFYYQ